MHEFKQVAALMRLFYVQRKPMIAAVMVLILLVVAISAMLVIGAT